MIGAFAVLLAAADPAVVKVVLTQSGDRCVMRIGAASADLRDTKALDVLLYGHDPAVSPVDIETVKTMTYRCIGGAVYLLQMRGFRFVRMGYVTDPNPRPAR